MRTVKFAVSKFSTYINPKDGHAVADCVDPREWRVLEFVVPIMYPGKPTRITVTLGNTIFGALSTVQKVTWGVSDTRVSRKVSFWVGEGKPSPISPYLFHLYHRFECLIEEEMTMLEAARYMLEFDVTLKAKTQPDTVDLDTDQESLNSTEQRKLQTITPTSKKKQTYWAANRKAPV